MTRLFAVTWYNEDGPDSITLVEAADAQEATEKVLKALHAIDMDAITIDQLVARNVGHPWAELFVLTEDATLQEIKLKEVT